MLSKQLKSPAYAAIRTFTRCRLNWLPLSMQQGEWWAEHIKRYPAFYQGDEFSVDRELPDGFKMRVGIIDHIERHVRIEGYWDRPVEHVLRAFLKPGGTFLDVGANIGYFTLLASRLVGLHGQVVSIEPSQRALRKLTHNLYLNRCNNVLLLSVGAGETFQSLKLTLATQNNIGGSTILPEAGSLPTESIAVIPLAALLSPLKIQPDLIKLDIEGFELFALKGLLSALGATPPMVCEVTAEFLHRNRQSVRELFDFMASHGYDIYRLRPDAATVIAVPLEPTSNYEQDAQFDALFVPRDSAVPLPVSAT